jgi:hypothetical protein
MLGIVQAGTNEPAHIRHHPARHNLSDGLARSDIKERPEVLPKVPKLVNRPRPCGVVVGKGDSTTLLHKPKKPTQSRSRPSIVRRRPKDVRSTRHGDDSREPRSSREASRRSRSSGTTRPPTRRRGTRSTVSDRSGEKGPPGPHGSAGSEPTRTVSDRSAGSERTRTIRRAGRETSTGRGAGFHWCLRRFRESWRRGRTVRRGFLR